MGTKNYRWVENMNDPTLTGPRLTLGNFAAGASQAITAGQLLERTGNSDTEWVPIDADHDATSTKLAIAACDISSGDPAGLYPIVEFRPGDVFEFDLASATALAPETALYYSSPTAMATSGSNILGYSAREAPNGPGKQFRNSQGQLGDAGTTYRSTGRCWIVFREAVSSYSLIQRA